MHMTNLSRVDLNLLVVLDAIVAEGGVSRAAERLNLTQPAVSHALARLRELFDDPLFVREGRNLAPTALTKGLIEPLRQSLQALGTLIEQGESFDPALSETGFTVSMRDPMEVLILPRLIKRFARTAPRIDLRTVQVRRRSLETGLADGTLDAALDVALPLSERIHRQRVSSDRFVVAARTASAAMSACAAATTLRLSGWWPRATSCSPCRPATPRCSRQDRRRCGHWSCRFACRRSISSSIGTTASTTIRPIAGCAPSSSRRWARPPAWARLRAPENRPEFFACPSMPGRLSPSPTTIP